MKKLVSLFLTGLLLFSGTATTAWAGPWTLKQGKAWTEVFTRYFHSRDYFDPKGEKHRWPDHGNSEIWDVEGKLEYGATDDFNLLLGIPYTWNRWANDYGTAWDFAWGPNTGRTHREGFKQINFGAKYRIMEKPVVTSVQVKYFVDTASDQVTPPDLYEYGNSLDVRALVGKAFNIDKKLTYFSVESGYRFNGGQFANTFPVFAELGFAPVDRLMLKGEIDCSFSHMDTGYRKDGVTWRVGTIFNLLGKGFNSIEKGGDSSLNLELQYGQTLWGRGDGRADRYHSVSQAQEFIFKVQALF
ncbi:MAG: hypothetical protein GF408_03910 [Candidatus Omnitrophica bacterium]|nr:hypothetical protein [Candidatus Omnitrophota bacterium]